MDIDDIRFKIAASRRMLFRGGCDSGVAGHVSVRVPGEDAFRTTPFEYFDETTPDRVLKVSFDLEVLEGDWPASPAIQFHAAVYRARADVNSVIHTHSHWATLLSSLRQPLGMYNASAVIFYGVQAFYEDDGTKPSVDGARMAEALGDCRVLFMKNHGMLFASDTLENATIEAIAFEDNARFHVEAVQIGGTEIPEAEVIQSRRDYDIYYRKEMWDANMRRLRRSDPDLFEYLD